MPESRLSSSSAGRAARRRSGSSGSRPSSKLAAAAVAAVLALPAASFADTAASRSFAPPEAGRRWVEKTMSRMTVEEKVGQLIACRFNGKFYNAQSPTLAELERLVVKGRVGGMVLFGGEVYETARLLNHLQKLAKVPLLVASDFERGTGNQITGATLFPPLMSIGAARSEAVAREMGEATAVEGRAMGIHMTYAPVVDVNINPDNPIINTRSAGEEPELVATIAAAFIEGVQANGMLATAKHFPGHGDTSEDSHNLLPTITADRARLDAVELYPFRRAVKAGVRAVMTAHLSVPALDPTPGLPATLSEPILTGLLRKEMGFKGLIVTDALEMRGITNAYRPGEAALKALQAGADVLLLPVGTFEVIDYLAGAVRDGRLSQARLDQSVRRVLEAKAALDLAHNRFADLDNIERVVGGPRFERIARRAFEASVTLVRNENGALPLAAGSGARLVVLSLSSDPGDYFAGRQFAAEVKRRVPEAVEIYADGDTGAEALQAAFTTASAADAVVVAVFSKLSAGKGSVDLMPGQVELINGLMAPSAAGRRPKLIVLSFGSPYFLRRFPGVDAYVCLYRNTPETQAIGAAAVFGELGIDGRLPVSLPGLYPAGHGLKMAATAAPAKDALQK